MHLNTQISAGRAVGAALRAGLLTLVGAVVLSACTMAPMIPPARPIVNPQGVRLNTSQERMDSAAAWVTREITNIQQDPSFLIETVLSREVTYPWETLEIARGASMDSARISIDGLGRDATTAYQVYAHLHLMKALGRIEEFYPAAVDLEGYELEEAILARVAEAWLYGRAILSTIPHPVWDEITYAAELGYLEPMILVAMPDRFPEERRAWEAANPTGVEDYRTWFATTFDREPPGLREQDQRSAGVS